MTGSTQDNGPSEEAKAKFREALERKKERNHPTADGDTNTGVVHGPESVAQTQRTFRRKSG